MGRLEDAVSNRENKEDWNENEQTVLVGKGQQEGGSEQQSAKREQRDSRQPRAFTGGIALFPRLPCGEKSSDQCSD